jgi:class 3 adenylate cyclase/tetratricopeptide (TPR) repeat protein
MKCAACSQSLPANAAICLHCGASASGRASAQLERRLLTVLFCDLVGSTELSARLDVEDLSDLLRSYQQNARRILEKAGGQVARYAGDGILAYFGYPAANEDDAERAVRAGLELVTDAVKDMRLPERLNVRVGIATGVVVIGDASAPGADQPPVIGEAPNLAARLQALAEPATVVIASNTQRLVGGLFDYRDLDLQNVKGFPDPVRAWQVLRPSQVASRFEALRSKLPLIGRDTEIDDLLAHWNCAKAGAGRAVVLQGDSGIGKSRLAFEFLARVRTEFPVIRRYFASERHQDSMLHPVLAQLQQAALLDRTEPARAKLEKLQTLIGTADAGGRQMVALLADLMGIPGSDQFGLTTLPPRRKRDLLFEMLLNGMVGVSRQRPIVVLAEDIHWLDPTSRALLDQVIGRVASVPVLLLLTTRTEAVWRDAPHVFSIRLGPISVPHAMQLVEAIAGQDLPMPIRQQIVTRADGIPLYIEELTRAAHEDRTGSRQRPGGSAEPAIPPSLHSSMLARLDHTGAAADVAKFAAAIGREFTVDLLQALLPLSSAQALQTSLEQLIAAEIILPVGPPPWRTFCFRHALIQDAAHGMLLRSTRKTLHGRIAGVLCEQFPETVAMQPEIVAGHYASAEMPRESARFWLAAGERAVGRSALTEAGKHFTAGLEQTRLLPPSSERMRLELDLHLALGPATMALNGYASQEALSIFSRAERLVSRVGRPSEHLDVLLGLFNVYYGRAEMEHALAVARQHLDYARRHGRHEARAHCLIGQTYSSMGRFADARHHLQTAIDLFRAGEEPPQRWGVFADQRVVAHALIAGVHYALGDPGQTSVNTAESISRAHRLEHPLSLALALVTRLLTPCGDSVDVLAARADEAAEFCKRHGFRNFEAWANFARGAITARRGDPARGIEQMHAAMAANEAIQSRLFRPTQLATLGGAHARLGRLDEARRLVREAIATAEKTGERQVEPSLHRLLGELLLAANRRDEAETEFIRALAVARAQGVKLEEARILACIAGLDRTKTAPVRPRTSRRLPALMRVLLGM